MSWASFQQRMRAVTRRLHQAVPIPARHVAGLARGTVVAQILMLAAIPVLARLYGVEAFGVFGVFSTTGAALSVAAAGRFEQAIIPAPRDRDAAALVHVSVAIVAATCALLACGLVAATPVLARWVASPPMRAALYWLPLGVAMQALGQIQLQWATRHRRDTVIARFYAERALVMSATQIGLGVLGIGQNGLVLGQIAGFTAAALVMRGRLRGLAIPDAAGPDAAGPAAASAVVRNALQAARANLDFPRFGLPRTLIEAAAAIAQPIIVASLFGAVAMGGYWMALRILSLPAAVLGEPIKQIFFRKATERRLAGLPLFPMLMRAIMALSIITVPFAGVLLLGSQTVFSVLLGPSWALAAVYVKILAVGWVVYFFAALFPAVVILLGLQKQHVLFEVGLRTAEAGAMLIGYLAGTILVSLALWATVNVIYVVVMLGYLRARDLSSGRGPAIGGGGGAPVPEGRG